MKLYKIGLCISILLPVILLSLIINFVTGFIPTFLQGIPIFLPLFLCPIGIILATLAYKVEKNKWAKTGIILNSLLFITPIAWMIIGLIFFGV
ncbi:hypothetical protein [Bacillus bombysepticus]|uniref:hypothetical protein n=1 Tax=Bacillus bombysepticus TaxID=658666 RepID=UPI0030175D41